jgi:hypothetical protein
MPKEVQTEIPPETSEQARGGLHVSWIVWAVPTLLILYVLSIGPAARLQEAGIISWRVTAIMYRPIDLFCARFDPTGRFYIWYVYDVWHFRGDVTM